MRTKHTTQTRLQSDQSGIVSIMITMLLMIMVGLIVIGFANLARRNSRETLDRQQGTQAYYAAETGMNLIGNKVISLINSGVDPATFPGSWKTQCGSFISANGVANTIDSASNVRFTCALVNALPTSLNYTTGAIGSSTVVPLNLSGPLDTINFAWDADAGGLTNGATCNGNSATLLPAASAWNCSYALLRVDMLQVPGALDTTSLANNMATFYILPSTVGTTFPVNSFTSDSSRSNIVQAMCAVKTCKATLKMNGAASSTAYYARFSYVYKNAKNIIVTAKATDGTNEKFSGAQAIIDITGQAQDQVRRIQGRVRLSAANDTGYPDSALDSSASICKYFAIAPGDPAATFPDTSPACKYQ